MNQTERDPTIDAAWREASREEPPVALDAAIRAEARRAMRAGPQRTRDKHWWYPLAAAATVAVIAIGLLQLTPPERVAPTVVADMTATSRTAPHEAPSAPIARRDEPVAAAPAAVAPAVPATAVVVPAAPASNAEAPARSRAAAVKKDAFTEEQAQPAGTSAGVLQAAPEPKPQPAAADKLARAGVEVKGGAAAPQPAPPAASAPRGEPFPAAPPATALPATAPPMAAPAPRREAFATDDRQLRSGATLAKATSSEPVKLKQTPAHSVEDWITLIRKLRIEGRLAEATKELAAFRDAYGERADSLLPPDLRELNAQQPAPSARP